MSRLPWLGPNEYKELEQLAASNQLTALPSLNVRSIEDFLPSTIATLRVADLKAIYRYVLACSISLSSHDSPSRSYGIGCLHPSPLTPQHGFSLCINHMNIGDFAATSLRSHPWGTLPNRT